MSKIILTFLITHLCKKPLLHVRSNKHTFVLWLNVCSNYVSSFVFNWFDQKSPSELLINHPKYFQFWFQIRRLIEILDTFTYSVSVFILRIWWMRLFLPVYSANTQFKPVQRLIYIILRILQMSTVLFLLFLFYSAIHTDSFREFGEHNKIKTNIRNKIIFNSLLLTVYCFRKQYMYVCVQLDSRPTRKKLIQYCNSV